MKLQNNKRSKVFDKDISVDHIQSLIDMNKKQ